MTTFPLRTAALLAILLLPAVAGAELLVNVTAGFGGYYRPGRWCPIVVTIENAPGEGKAGDASLTFEGRLFVDSENYDERTPTYTFARNVTVPGFSKQRFVLLARFNDQLLRSPELLIRSRNGRLLSRHPIDVQPLRKSQVLAVVVQEQGSSLNFPAPGIGEANPLTRAVMSPRELFDTWAAYDSVDALIFPGWPEGNLAPTKVQAVKDWVAMGGSAVVRGGS